MRTIRSRITLPVLDGTGAVALAQQIESAANALSPKPPASVAAAIDDIVGDRNALQQAIAAQTALDDRPDVHADDVLEDAAWGMLRDFVSVFFRLPADHPSAIQAHAVHDRIFGNEGLSFTQLPVDKQRAAADTKMMLIKQEGLDKTIKELGGKIIWDFLASTHPRYVATVEAAIAQASQPTNTMVQAFDNLKDALDLYLVRVLATVDRKKPETMKTADALLAPVLQYKAAHKAKARAAAPVPPPAPAPLPTEPKHEE